MALLCHNEQLASKVGFLVLVFFSFFFFPVYYTALGGLSTALLRQENSIQEERGAGTLSSAVAGLPLLPQLVSAPLCKTYSTSQKENCILPAPGCKFLFALTYEVM